MELSEEQFLEELRKAFLIEAQEHIEAITSGLLDMEGAQDPQEAVKTLETVYRCAHSMKGASRAVNLSGLESVSHSLESLLLAYKRGAVGFTARHYDVMLRAADVMSRSLDPDSNVSEADLLALADELEILAKGDEAGAPPAPAPAAATPSAPTTGFAPPPAPTAPAPPAPQAPAAEARTPEPALGSEAGAHAPAPGTHAPAPAAMVQPAPAALKTPGENVDSCQAAAPPSESQERPANDAGQQETVRVRVERLGSLLVRGEELLSVKQALWQRIADMEEIDAKLSRWEKDSQRAVARSRALRASRQRQDADPERDWEKAQRLFEHLDLGLSRVKTLRQSLEGLGQALRGDFKSASQLTEELLDQTKETLMFPFGSITAIFPKMVRDIARELGKDVRFTLSGENVEMDRRILEELKAPLIHLLRNALDHGLEPPADRKRLGKPAQGLVSLSVHESGAGKVEVVVADDGRGVNIAKLASVGVRSGLISPEEAQNPGPDTLLRLIFSSGLSTSPIITDLSGRGVGMAIVEENVRKLGGSVGLETEEGQGTAFSLRIPVKLATFRGVLVRAETRRFVLPTVNVERVLLANPADVGTVGNASAITVGTKSLSLVWLGDALGLPRTRKAAPGAWLHVVLAASGETRMAFAVDEVDGEQEVLFKRLGGQLAGLANIAGATILGSGEIVPILNVADLMKSALASGSGRLAGPSPELAGEAGPRNKSILVVEDSITSRMLLKGILEAAGYQVLTAVDGLDGLTTLKTEDVDMVITDVEMPRMDGFALTRSVRETPKLAELPVVLVTARGSREDRERGVEVGANAYIVKSGFDQSNLLQVIQKML
ncbi:hypothetical protein JCM15519_34620 [Fundidesulfovibrio butyratiphilus]